ncbi:hypothetical protein C0J52_09335 [Blattella germanica]|nr:hypothetical protein C0J52_09335 [Blattella germanica]
MNMSLVGRHFLKLNLQKVCLLHTSAAPSFWERDPKGGYLRNKDLPSRSELIREGLKELKDEIKLWKEEVTEHLIGDPILAYRKGEVDIQWCFNTPEALLNWTTTSDKDHNEGHSSCELQLSKGGKGLFSGTLSTQIPRDGRIKKAGYCNMRSIRPRKSFKRDAYFDWRMYSHIVLRVRGDGRSYMLNISTMGYYDIFWNDIYSYALYTRGGPYWQISKIPFSKFFLTSKGRIQDKQNPIPLDKVTNVGISAGDKINGPFRLEIDYIGLEFDPTHTETFAYEMCDMAPVTRSSRKCTVKEPIKARHILSDMTNMSKKPKVGESELQRSIDKNTKVCVYSSIVNDNLKPEEKSDVYDFQGNNSPPRKKNKRNIKPKRKRFSLSDTEDDEETPVQSMKLRNARKKHVPVKKRNNHKVSLEDQKIKISNTQEFKVTAVKNASKTVKFTPDTIPETEKAIVLNKVVKSTQHIMNTKESSSITEAKDSAAKITKKVVIDTPKNNKSMSQETELQDNQEYDEIGCFISLNNDKSAPLREIKDNDKIKNIITSKNDKTIPMGDKLNDYRRVNTQALAKGRLFASTPAESTKSFNFRNEIDQDNSYSCPQENKENSPDANFRHPSEMFILSPIERDSRTNFITKRKVKNKPRVEDFTIENCFGFDESEDEINISAHHTNVPFSLSSTPFVNKKPARPFKELPRLVLPAQATQFCTKLPILRQGSSKRVTFSLSNQNTISQLSLGSSAISINSSKQSMLKKQNATQYFRFFQINYFT